MDKGAENYRRYLAGDDGALADIIRDYRDGLVFFLNGFVNDVNAAEELTEDVFVKLAVKKPVFRERSSFKTWLYAIGRNEAYRQTRKNRIVYTAFDDIPDDEGCGGFEPEILRDERHRLLYRCMRRLKSEYHRALWLFYFEGFSAKEISAIMKKSPHNVETLLYRARQAVKRELELEGFEYENL